MYNNPDSRKIAGFGVLALFAITVLVNLAWPSNQHYAVLSLTMLPCLGYGGFWLLNETIRPTGTTFKGQITKK
jgi:hypothetical protein